MTSSDTKVQTAAQLFEQIRSYLTLERKYIRLDASERISKLLSALLLTFILLGVGMLVFTLGLLTLAHLLIDLTADATLSYALVTLFALILAGLIWGFRNVLIVRPVNRFIDNVLNPKQFTSLPDDKEQLQVSIKLSEKEIRESFDQLTATDSAPDPTIGERVGSMIDRSMAVYRGATFAMGLFNLFKTKSKADTTTKATKLPSLVLLLLSLLTLPSCAQEPTTFMVISDVHVLPTTLFDDTTALAGDPKLAAQSQELFDSALVRIREAHPNLLLVPGDLSYNGELEAHAYVSQQLNELVDEGIQVLVIPGNHDIDNPTARAFFSHSEAPQVQRTTAADFTSLYEHCGYGDAILRHDASLSYLAYSGDDLAILCLDSTRPNANVTRYSEGGLTLSVLDWIDEAVSRAHADGHHRILAMMHHPVMEHFDHQSEVASNYVSNSDTNLFPALDFVQQRLMNAGIQVMFSGHFHIQSIQHVTDERGHELHDVSTGSLSAYASPIRSGNISSEGKLSLSSDYITRYQELGKKRNDAFAYTIFGSMSNKLYPKFDKVRQSLPSMFQSMVALPADAKELAQDLRTYLYAPVTDVYHALSYGDEDQYNPEEIYLAYQDSLTAYMGHVCKGNALLVALLRESLLADDGEGSSYIKQTDEIIRSILYNYVDTPSNWVPDRQITLQIENSTAESTDPDALLGILPDANRRYLLRYSLDGKPLPKSDTSRMFITFLPQY